MAQGVGVDAQIPAVADERGQRKEYRADQKYRPGALQAVVALRSLAVDRPVEAGNDDRQDEEDDA